MKEAVPRETETIAARRAFRLAEKIRNAKNELRDRRSLWSGRPLEVGLVLLLFLLNLYVVYPLLNVTAVDQPFSGPVIPLLIKILNFFRISDTLAFQLVNFYFYLLFPLSLYFFVKEITKRKLTSFLAVLIASLPFYPMALGRVLSSFNGIDAAHIASLSVLPIALFSNYLFIKHGGVSNLISAAVTSALIALIAPFGFLTFIIFTSILTFSEMLLGNGRLKMIRFLAVLVFAGGLNSFWYNPGFFIWMIFGPMGSEVRATILKLLPLSFFTIPALGAFGYLLFDRKPNLQPLFLASFFTLTFFLISIVGGGFFPSHPARYIPELGISLAFFISVMIIGLTDNLRLHFPTKIPIKKIGLFINAFLVVMIFGLFVITVKIGREVVANERVLGVWDDIEKGEIWKARDQFTGPVAFLGYSITVLSVSGLSLLTIKEKRKAVRKEST